MMRKTSRLFLLCLLLLVLLQPAACNDDDDDDNNDNDDATPGDDDTVDDDDDNDDNNDNNDAPVEYDYDVPVKSTSPWPMFRRTSRNDGSSPITPEANDLDVWKFQTDKGMFHAPVIDEDGTVYMGSADTYFYAINPDGTEKWRFATGEIVDSAALIAADSTIFLPAGDGYLYAIDPDGTEKWRMAALGLEGFITWWEGHITMGPDGNLYAGNDDRRLYAISQDGEILWTYQVFDQIWSCPSFGNDGILFFGSNDLMLRSLTPDGERRWTALTLGPVASSPALNDSRDRVFVGSFDGYVHAYDAASGDQVWKFAVRDHIYATPAISPDGTIYVGAADGTLYALNPDGSLKWAFDTLDPIRSSAAIDGDGNVYFGCGDGKLYSLAPDGSKRWSFDTSEGDRNDLNGPPAIGPDGVYIGGEAGALWFVPFGYCAANDDERCDTDPAEDIPSDGALLYYYSEGGSSYATIPREINPTDVLTFRLVVRETGDTTRARIKAETLNVQLTPNFTHRVEVSADGNFFSVIPEETLPMETDYEIAIDGDYLVGGWRLGNKLIGGSVGGQFGETFSFTTSAPTGHALPLMLTADDTTVLRLRRIAAPQPPMLTTFNQIGFDSYNYLLSIVDTCGAQFHQMIMLAVEGTPGLEPVTNIETKSIFPLKGHYKDSYFSLEAQGFTLDVTGVSIALDLFRIGGLLNQDLTSDALNIYAEATCGNVEFFGPVLNLLGLCHPGSGKLIVNGTALFEPHDGPEGARPPKLTVNRISLTDTGGLYGGGYIQADFDPNTLLADEHLPVILVINEAQCTAPDLAYGVSLEKTADGDGHLESVTLHLQPGFDPNGKKAVVIVNLYPVAQRSL